MSIKTMETKDSKMTLWSAVATWKMFIWWLNSHLCKLKIYLTDSGRHVYKWGDVLQFNAHKVKFSNLSSQFDWCYHGS